LAQTFNLSKANIPKIKSSFKKKCNKLSITGERARNTDSSLRRSSSDPILRLMRILDLISYPALFKRKELKIISKACKLMHRCLLEYHRQNFIIRYHSFLGQ
jgi:hypothetical protein